MNPQNHVGAVLTHQTTFYALYVSSLVLLVILFSDKPYYVLALFGLVTLFLSIIAWPGYSFCILPLFLAFPFVIVPDTRLHLGEFAIGSLMIATVLGIFNRQLKITMPLKGMIFLIFLTSILSLISSQYPMESFLGLLRIIIAFGFIFPVFYTFMNSQKKIYYSVYGIIAAGLIAAVYGILENYISSGSFTPTLGLRIFGKAGAFYGSYLGLAILAIVSLVLFYKSTTWFKMVIGFLIIPLGLALSLSQTRGWILATALGLLAIGVVKLHQKKMLKFVSILIITVTTSSLILGLLTTDVPYGMARKVLMRHTGRVSTLTISRLPDFSFEQRLRFWRFGWGLFLQQPFFGVGIGNLRIANTFSRPHLVEPTIGMPYVDNQFLHILIETGVAGLFAWLLFIVSLVKISIKNVSLSLSDNLSAVSVFLIGAIVLYGVGGIFWVMSATLTSLCMLALIFSLVFSLNRLLIQEESVPNY